MYIYIYYIYIERERGIEREIKRENPNSSRGTPDQATNLT